MSGTVEDEDCRANTCRKCGRTPTVQTHVLMDDRYPKRTGFYLARLACKGRFGLWAHVGGLWKEFFIDRGRKGLHPRSDLLVPAWDKANRAAAFAAHGALPEKP